MGADSKSPRVSWRYVVAAVWVAACGGAVGETTVGGESHFLRHCGDGCGPGLECVSEICTRSCRIEDAGSCEDLASAARCTNTSIEPGVIAVCDQACESFDDCREHGADFACVAGYCRGPGVPVSQQTPKPTAGQSSGGTTPQSGGGTTTLPGGGTTTLPGGGTGAVGVGGSSSGAGGGGQPLPEVCSLPFEGGDCDGAFPVFAFVAGACQPLVYGGCGGNGNRFNSVEECLGTCEQRPSVHACADGRVEREICVACGPAGGCGQTLLACAQPCDAETVCASRFFTCLDDVCQQTQCE